jgi:hypothetical protein
VSIQQAMLFEVGYSCLGARKSRIVANFQGLTYYYSFQLNTGDYKLGIDTIALSRFPRAM